MGTGGRPEPVVTMTAEEAANTLQTKGSNAHTWHEYVKPQAMTKVFLMRHVYFKDLRRQDDRVPREEVLRHEEEVRRQMGEMFTANYVVAKRNGFNEEAQCHALSFFVVVLGMHIRVHTIPRLVRYYGQETFWDLSVLYRSAHATLLPCINCVRSGEDRRLLCPQREPVAPPQAGLDTDAALTAPGRQSDPLLYVVQHMENIEYEDAPPGGFIEPEQTLGYEEPDSHEVLHDWLRSLAEDSKAGGTCLMPLRPGSKQPMRAHKNGAWTWASYDAFRRADPRHHNWGLLMDGC